MTLLGAILLFSWLERMDGLDTCRVVRDRSGYRVHATFTDGSTHTFTSIHDFHAFRAGRRLAGA